MSPLLTIDEAAEALNVSRRTVYGLVHDGKLATVTIGRSRRVRQASVERFIERNERYAGERRRAS